MFETDETEDLRYKQLPNNEIAGQSDYYNRKYQPLQTLAVSNANGLTFIATANSVKAYFTKDLILMQPTVPQKNNIPPYFLDLSLSNNFGEAAFECIYVALNSDDSLLSISVIKFQSSSYSYFILFYDIHYINKLLNNQAKNFTEKASYIYALSSNECLLNLTWNPTIEKTFCFLSSKLYKIEIDFKDDSFIINKQTLEYNNKLTSICWSPKGKQLLGGLETGDIIQIKYDLTVVKKIPAPFIEHTEITNLKPVNLIWISTYSILCCYQAIHESEDDTTHFFVHIITNKDLSQPAIYHCYEDPYYDTKASLAGSRSLGMGREQRLFWLFNLPAWNNLLVGVTNDDPEIISFAPGESDHKWKILGIEDTFRPVLPVFETDGQTMEMFPTGAAIDYTTNCDVLFPRNVQYPPAPVLFIMTDAGLLCAFSIVATWPNIPSLNVTPKPFSGQHVIESLKPISKAITSSKSIDLPTSSSSSQSVTSTISQPFSPDKSRQLTSQPPVFSVHSKPAVEITQNISKQKSSLPDVTNDNVRAKDPSQNLTLPEIEVIKDLRERINSLKRTAQLYRCKERKEGFGVARLPAFITLPLYLETENSDLARLQAELSRINKLTERLEQEVSLQGKERLLDTYASIELVGDVLQNSKMAKADRASCNPAIYKAPKGNNNNTLSRLADHVLYNLNERFRDVGEAVNRLKRKIDLKIEEYNMENVDLMKKLKISDDTLTYNCLKVNSKILVQLEREYNLILARFSHMFPNATQINSPRQAKGDADPNPMIDQILKNLKKQSLDCKNTLSLNAPSISKTLNPKSRYVLESVCKRVANSKIRNIDISRKPPKTGEQPRFDQIFSVATSVSATRHTSAFETKTDSHRIAHAPPILSEKIIQGNKPVVSKIEPFPVEKVPQSIASIEITKAPSLIKDIFQAKTTTKNTLNFINTSNVDQIASIKQPDTISILSVSSNVITPKVSHPQDDLPLITTPSKSLAEICVTETVVSTSTPIAPVAPFISSAPKAIVSVDVEPIKTTTPQPTLAYSPPTTTLTPPPENTVKPLFGFSNVQTSSLVFPSPMPNLLASVVSTATEDLKATITTSSPISLPNFSFNINSNLPSQTVSPFTTTPIANPFGIKGNIPTPDPSSASIFGTSFGATPNFGLGESVPKTTAPTLLGSALQGFGSGVKPVFGASAAFGSPPASQSHLFGSAPVFGAPSAFTGFNLPSTLSQNPLGPSVGFGVSVAEPQGTPSFAALAQMAPSFGSLPQQQPVLPPSAFGFGAAVTLSSPTNFGFGMQNPATPVGFGSPVSPAFGSPNESASLGNSFMAYR